MKSKYWLSICIPTYNRADKLEVTLKSIISQPIFDGTIEIIISDNASTDKTQELANSYTEMYNNIKYFRNLENLKDGNFPIGLSYAKGEYIKFLSDNKPINRNFFENMKIAIAKEPSIIFHQLRNSKQFRFIETNNANEFIDRASFYSTWLPGYTFKKENIENINYNTIDTSTHLFQTQLVFDVLKHYSRCIFIVGRSMESIEPTRKGGYDIFKVFIDNYLTILKNTKIVDKYHYFIEKNRLLIKFLFLWIYQIYFENNDYSFKHKYLKKYLVKYYKYNLLLLLLPLYISYKKIKSILLK